MRFDPLEVVLFHILERALSVSSAYLWPFDEQRAERVLARAGLHQYAPGLWQPTDRTRAWSRTTFTRICVDPNHREVVDPRRRARRKLLRIHRHKGTA